ncbi:hypothetical protein SGLAM104S_03569 [Streptomyces glaucescens]
MAAHPGGLTAAREQDGTTGQATVRIENLVRSFGERRILDGLDLTIAPGEFVALLGRSGSGKSTLLRALARLDDDVAGSGSLAAPDHLPSSSRTPGCCPGNACSAMSSWA